MITGLSGNELFCLNEKGYTPGNLVIGNSVFSLGFVGSLTSGLKTLGGGEIHELTELIREGREMAYMRMIEEARRHVGAGVTGVTNQLIFHDTNVEYLAIGSAVHRDGESNKDIPFSTSANGQELYCQLDCGFHPCALFSAMSLILLALVVVSWVHCAVSRLAKSWSFHRCSIRLGI
jgi:uncharacterized protein YbjQ (UPF0145 family)